MDPISLDDQLKLAQIAREHAEAKKLEKEAAAVRIRERTEFWTEAVKILGGVVLGIGGVIAAVSQYKVSQAETKLANLERAQAEADKKTAEEQAFAAQARLRNLQAKASEVEAYVDSLKKSLNTASSELRTANPNAPAARLVYIQFQGALKRETINELRQDIAAKGFNLPGAERVGGQYRNMVKYFKPGQEADAAELKRAVEAFFSAKHCPVTLDVEKATGATVANPPLEVWIANKCGDLSQALN